MKKTEQKLNVNSVEIGLGRPADFRGITLIALVISIIVILILVGVSITVALKGGLFSTAKQGKSDTQGAINVEQTLANGKIKVDGKWYNSIDDYLEENPLPPTYAEAQKDGNRFLEENATLTEGDYTATIPKGFKISEKEGEGNIETGLVIQDAKGNEFVWIPVTEKLENSYAFSSDYIEPKVLSRSYDGQSCLDSFYTAGYYNYEKDFNYVVEYEEMVKSVNKYNGFYIGRYETIIDGDSIGSKENKRVLDADRVLVADNRIIGTGYYWYGLYAEQKKADVTGNGEDIQTAMIYGVLWDKTMDFIRKQKGLGYTDYDVDISTPSWHTASSVVNSGQANKGDIALNIWDLEGNAREWTQEADSTEHRATRGGDNDTNLQASERVGYMPTSDFWYVCSRLVLFIKMM